MAPTWIRAIIGFWAEPLSSGTETTRPAPANPYQSITLALFAEDGTYSLSRRVKGRELAERGSWQAGRLGSTLDLDPEGGQSTTVRVSLEGTRTEGGRCLTITESTGSRSVLEELMVPDID